MTRVNFISVGDYVFPEIDSAWKKHQKEMLREVKVSKKPFELSIDGQCDSPGQNATYCTVSAMDNKTEKIVDFQIVDVKEVKNSQRMVNTSLNYYLSGLCKNINPEIKLLLLIITELLRLTYSNVNFLISGMEKEGFIRCVQNLDDDFGTDVGLISTDRH